MKKKKEKKSKENPCSVFFLVLPYSFAGVGFQVEKAKFGTHLIDLLIIGFLYWYQQNFVQISQIPCKKT